MKDIMIFLITALLFLMTNVSNAECVCENENDPNTPLNQSILAMDDSTLALNLIDDGMPPDTTNACGAGLLLMASIYDDTTLAEKLLAEGANPNVMNFQGHTPVQSAAEWSSNEVLDMLLKAGGDPNPELIPCYEKVPYNTPLLGAAVNNNIEGIELLLRHNADFTASSPNGDSFFDLLLVNNNEIESILEIIENVPIHKQEKALNDLLFSVAMKGSKVDEMIEILSIPHDPNFSVDENTPYNTPLLIAALAENIDGVKALSEHGADIHYTNSEGYSLERIVHENNLEELYYLFPSSEE